MQDLDNLPDAGFLRINEVATVLRVHKNTVWRMIKRGDLTPYRITPRTTTINIGELKSLTHNSKSGEVANV